MPETTIKPFPFRIGADPEFNILVRDQHFKADALFRSLFKDKLTARDMGYLLPRTGEIGWDGNSDVGELRPQPANTPEGLVENIKKLLQAIAAENPLLELSVLSDMAVVGGHIHFELPNMEDNVAAKTLAGKIHKKMSSFYIPLVLGEDIINLRTRAKSGYGKITEFRCEEHGNANTYEFRLPSAEWMATEKIAKATLAYFATVYNEILNHPKNFAKCNGLIFKNEVQGMALQSLAISHFKLIMSTMLNKIKKYIKTFEFYQQYQSEIDFVLSPEKLLKEKEAVKFNMTTGWNLVKTKKPSKRELFARTTAKQLKTLPNLETLMEMIPINFNPDINISEFVNVLKQKIMILNWKLDYIYYFFGLKQGIEDFIIKNKAGEYLDGQNQIKTKEDRAVIDETFQRMSQKFGYLKTRSLGKGEERDKQYVLIGIPYHLRMALKTKPMLERIYQLERGRVEAVKVDSNSLPETVEVNGKSSCGSIAEIYRKQTGEPVNTLANESRTSDNLIRRQEVEREIAREEEENESNNKVPQLSREELMHPSRAFLEAQEHN